MTFIPKTTELIVETQYKERITWGLEDLKVVIIRES